MDLKSKFDLEKYFSEYHRLIKYDGLCDKLILVANMIKKNSSKNRKLFFIGNGAGAAIASHLSLDMNKQAKIQSICINDSTLLSAYSNDLGFENSYAEILRTQIKPKDILIVFSVSGTSKNLLNAVEFSKSKNVNIISITGCNSNNPIKLSSDIDFWIDSYAYNIVECIGMIWLTSVVDLIIKKSIYKVS